jgi:dihydrofolate reductase
VPGKIVVTEYMSLDGVIEDPVGMEGSGLGNWTDYKRGPAGDEFKVDELKAADSLIFGRRTYEGFAAVWPTVNDPAGYAERMNRLPKYVASRSLADPQWSNSILWSSDLIAKTKALKAGGDGRILIFGSASIVHELMRHDLVDRFNLMIYPVILGRGKRLFPDGVSARLEPLATETFGGGILLTRYEVRR